MIKVAVEQLRDRDIEIEALEPVVDIVPGEMGLTDGIVFLFNGFPGILEGYGVPSGVPCGNALEPHHVSIRSVDDRPVEVERDHLLHGDNYSTGDARTPGIRRRPVTDLFAH